MVDTKLIDLTRSIARELALADRSEHLAIMRRHSRDLESQFGPPGADFVFDLLAIYKSNGGVSMSQNINMRDNFSGQVGGVGNTFSARDISIYNQSLEESQIVAPLKQELKDARAAIEAADLLSTAKDILIENFGQLTIELAKPSPEPSALKILMAGIKSVASTLEPVVKLLATVGTMYALGVS